MSITAEQLHRGEFPVAFNRNWLPRSESDQLRDLRERHVNLLTELQLLSRDYNATAVKYSEEDEQYKAGLQGAWTGGKEPKKPLTPVDERQRVMSAMSERYKAGLEVLAKLVNEVLTVIAQNHRHWAQQLNEREQELQKERVELAARLASLDGRSGRNTRLHTWLVRTAGEQQGFDSPGMRMMPFDTWGQPPKLGESQAAFNEEMARRRQEEARAAPVPSSADDAPMEPVTPGGSA